MPVEITVALVTACGGIAVAALGIWTAWRLGLGPINRELVSNLQARNSVKDERIAELERQVDQERTARQQLELRVAHLEALLADRMIEAKTQRRPRRSSEVVL